MFSAMDSMPSVVLGTWKSSVGTWGWINKQMQGAVLGQRWLLV